MKLGSYCGQNKSIFSGFVFFIGLLTLSISSLIVVLEGLKWQFQTWTFVASISAIMAAIMALVFFNIFAILHIAMEWKGKDIWITYEGNAVPKLYTAIIALICNIGVVTFSSINFFRQDKLNWIYYLKIFLLFINMLLVFLSYWSKKKADKYGNIYEDRCTPQQWMKANLGGMNILSPDNLWEGGYINKTMDSDFKIDLWSPTLTPRRSSLKKTRNNSSTSMASGSQMSNCSMVRFDIKEEWTNI